MPAREAGGVIVMRAVGTSVRGSGTSTVTS